MPFDPSTSSIDADRLWTDLMALAAITEPDRPWTRRSFTARFVEGRSWLNSLFVESGLSVRMDAGGNLIGRLDGRLPLPPIVLGSHSDTVPSGGRFDGAAGVIAAVEVARTVVRSGHRLDHPLEIVDFLAEEPSDYGISCIGSRAMVGALSSEMLSRTNAGGERLSDAIARVGGAPSALGQIVPPKIAAYLELHIEQGRVLESGRFELGIVSGIVGIARVELIFLGSADHAGGTPMRLRRDAGVAAAEIVSWTAKQGALQANSDRGHFVATTGIVEILPNAANVVPGQARLVLDIRAEDNRQIDDFILLLDRHSLDTAHRCGVKRDRFTIISRTDPTRCDPHLRSILAHNASKLNYSTTELASGAGHDAAFVARIGRSAMLFIPCLEGKSHSPDEWADPDALAMGTATLYEAVRDLDRADRTN
ncbi:N-carbamoyl-L-amino-acid hydrolase [Bradyrhizobium sp. F1.4.3]|uniref:Zn-dependent hydrolase n=1 Tax=Bradyrhizobium sp. F1.4.3 TaxID=3156356 RepID=UPI003398FD94